MSARWIKIPGPGQFRGEGEWRRLDEMPGWTVTDWEAVRDVDWLPTHEGDEAPDAGPKDKEGA